MNVAAVQFRPTKGDFASSLARLVPLVEEAADGADLVVLPEMALTGYIFRNEGAVRPVAEAPTGATFEALSSVAKRARAFIVAGFPEVTSTGALYNSALVIDREGALAFVYRKTLLYKADWTWARPGDSGYRTFDTGRGTFGVGICMDLNDDRFLDWATRAPMRAIAFPTNWLDQGEDIWSYWAERIYGTGSALVAANTYGIDDGTPFWGRSAILDAPRLPGGPCLLRAAAEPEGDVILRATLPANPQD